MRESAGAVRRRGGGARTAEEPLAPGEAGAGAEWSRERSAALVARRPPTLAPRSDAPSPCRACGGPGRAAFYKRGFLVAECERCRSAFVAEPLPASESYDEPYFDERAGTGYADYLADRDLILENFDRRVAWVAERAPGPRLLDVGAAYGFLLAAAARRGFDALGVEPVAACAAFAERELGVRIVSATLEQAELPRECFDVVTLFDVIEHLRDPRAAIERVRELLRPGGIVVVETGDRDALLSRVCGRRWYYYDPPQHLTYFSLASLGRMLESAGFDAPEAVGHLGRAVSLRNVAFQLARALGPGPLGRACRALSRSRAGRFTFHVPDRGNAFVLAARKR